MGGEEAKEEIRQYWKENQMTAIPLRIDLR